MATTEDSEIPETGAVFTFGKSKFADNIPNKFWVKNDRVHQIACGDEHTGLIAESGRVFMFGPNDWGQLGLDDNKGVNKPSCVKSLKHETAKLIACGRSHTLVATESGHIYSFGSNSDGQLGYEGVTDQYLPKQIESLRPTKYKILSAGADNSVALTEDGKVYVWGGNEEGKLGLGEDIEIAHQPMLLQLDRPVVCVACGYYHTALVTDDGKLYTMGEADGGKLGLPEDLEDTKVPQEVTAIAEPVKWVACGSSHTVALTESGKCYVFGEGESGQLGLGTDVMSLSTPTHLKLPFKVSRVYCGQAFTALISEKGQLYTFGDGRHGKLAHGNDQFSNQYKPYHCKRFSHFNVKKVACGGCHMIVTAQPKAHSHNVESDEEVDEMKTLAETALLDSLNMTTGSPTLSRSLSAREKRRNEVTRSLSTLNQTLPVLTSKRGIHPLSATMPAIKPNHSKANGDLLHATIVPKSRSLPRGKTLDIDHVVEPESTHHKGQADNSDDGSEGDDEGSDEGQHSMGHHGPKQVVEEVEEKLEADEDVMALTAELQSKIDEGSSEEEPLDEVDERSAGQDLPESITNTVEAGIHVEKVQEEMSSKDEITPTGKEIKESPVLGKKNPLPLPRKKQEKAEDDEEEEEEEEEETEEDEEVNEEEENSKKKNKKNKKEKGEKKKKDGKEDEKEKKKKDGEENEKDKKKKDKKDKKKKDDDDIKDDKKKEGKEDKKIDDDEDIKDKKKKDGKEDKKKKEDEESVKDKKKKDGKEDKKEDEDTKDKKKKDEKEPKDKKKDKKSKKDKKKNGDEDEDEEEEEKEDKKKDKKGKKEKEDKKNKKDKNKKGDKDKKKEDDEDEEDAEDEESNDKSKKKEKDTKTEDNEKSNDKSKKKEKDTKTEDNEKSNDKSKKKGKDAKIEEDEKNNSKVDKDKTDEALTKSDEKGDKANGKDENENENTQVPVTAKKSRTCSIL